jgi:tetratricopeptide (TPR) repeat protein
VRELPASREAYARLADALERLGRTREAYKAWADALAVIDGVRLPVDEHGLRAVIATRPSLGGARVALAGLLLARHDTDDAIVQLQAAAADPASAELADRVLAGLYLRQTRTDEAEHALRRAALREPQRYRSRIALADFLMAHAREDEARDWLDRASADPDADVDGAITLRRAAIDFDQGRTDAAREAVDGVVRTHPSPAAWTLQARFLLRAGDLDGALAAAGQALSLNPQYVPARNTRDEARREQLFAEHADDPM